MSGRWEHVDTMDLKKGFWVGLGLLGAFWVVGLASGIIRKAV